MKEKEENRKRKTPESLQTFLMVEVTGFEPATFWSRTHPRTPQPLEERLNSKEL